MSAILGPLLLDALESTERASSAAERRVFAARFDLDEAAALPVVFQLQPLDWHPGETWLRYSERFLEHFESLYEELADVATTPPRVLIAANAIEAHLPRTAIMEIQGRPQGRWIELNAPGRALQLDDVAIDISLPLLQARHDDLDGRGVTVAVLDSGIDSRHPDLEVAESVSTCGESVSIAGSHGTHVAGCLASRSEAFPGVAPGVRLLNIKVTRADNPDARPGDVLRGIDEALDRGAMVISLSLGYNHFPRRWGGGSGWTCPDGRCPLCTAADRAVDIGRAVVVAAAGNEHLRAEAARESEFGPEFDTEMVCPGQSRRAIAVGALQKHNFRPWMKTSQGPSSYGLEKPDLSASGVNVTSTIPVSGHVENLAPSELFGGRRSGTSVATPLVAGAAALLIQRHLDAGQAWTPEGIRKQLLGAVLPTGHPLVVGAGRLDLALI